MASKSLREDLFSLAKQPPPGISARLVDDCNLFDWEALIFGPGDTPFEGGAFRLRLTFPQDYPNRPPTVIFYSKMFHPNVYSDGRICIDVLQSKWKQDYKVATALCAIQALLGDPNPNSAANGEARDLFRNNQTEYNRRVKEIVLLSESGKPLTEEETKINYNSKK